MKYNFSLEASNKRDHKRAIIKLSQDETEFQIFNIVEKDKKPDFSELPKITIDTGYYDIIKIKQ